MTNSAQTLSSALSFIRTVSNKNLVSFDSIATLHGQSHDTHLQLALQHTELVLLLHSSIHSVAACPEAQVFHYQLTEETRELEMHDFISSSRVLGPISFPD